MFWSQKSPKYNNDNINPNGSQSIRQSSLGRYPFLARMKVGGITSRWSNMARHAGFVWQMPLYCSHWVLGSQSIGELTRMRAIMLFWLNLFLFRNKINSTRGTFSLLPFNHRVESFHTFHTRIANPRQVLGFVDLENSCLGTIRTVVVAVAEVVVRIITCHLKFCPVS